MPRPLPPPPGTGDLRMLRRLWPLVWSGADRVTRRRLVAVLALVLATSLAGALAPILFKHAVDWLSQTPQDAVAALPLGLLGGYVAAQWLGKLTAETRGMIYVRLEQRLQRRLAVRVFDHVQDLSLRFHVGRRTGALNETIANGLTGCRMVLSALVVTVLPLMLELGVIAIVLLSFYPPVFSGLVLVTAGLYSALFMAGAERQRGPQREAVAARVEGSGKMTDALLNYETVKYFGNERYVSAQVDDALTRMERGWGVFARMRAGYGVGQATVLAAGLAVVLWLAARNTASGAMTVGDLVLVNTYLLQLIRPLESIGVAYRELKQGLTYLESMLKLLGEAPEIADRPGAPSLPAGPGHVRFEQVGFAYDPRRPILGDVSFEIPAGRTVALVGPSGGGKSTIARLLFRFYDPTEGRITVEGVDIRDCAQASVRAAVAVVPQDTVLFNETLAYNIGFGRPGASRAEIEAAAALAQLAGFVEALPDGFDTMVGERGLKLSGGEKQRVAIARAVLKRPRIFVFDEATSALDTGTERTIQRNLEAVSEGTTTLMIAHRLSTVVNADQILVVRDGRIVERGTHDELTARDGVYAGMWRMQQRETRAEAAE